MGVYPLRLKQEAYPTQVCSAVSEARVGYYCKAIECGRMGVHPLRLYRG